MMKTFFEENGGTYRMVNGYRIPNLALPDETEYHIGLCPQRPLEYLKKHRKGLFINLLTEGNLHEHIHEIDVTARERRERIIADMMKAQGVTEQLKAENQMEWVGKVNNIRACVDVIAQFSAG